MKCGPDGIYCVCFNDSFIQEGNQCVPKGVATLYASVEASFNPSSDALSQSGFFKVTVSIARLVTNILTGSAGMTATRASARKAPRKFSKHTATHVVRIRSGTLQRSRTSRIN